MNARRETWFLRPVAASPHPQLVFFKQRVAPVKGSLVKLNPDFPRSLKRRIRNGFFNVFVDWSGKAGGKRAAVRLLRGTPEHGRVLSMVYPKREPGVIDLLRVGLDVKGVGVPRGYRIKKGSFGRSRTRKPFGSGLRDEVGGLIDVRDALKDWKTSERLAASGVRVARPVAVIELKELIDGDGKRVSVKDAVEKRLIPQGFRPALYLRAMAETLRLSDASRNKRVLGRFLLANGLGRDGYLRLLSERLGENMAGAHNAGVSFDLNKRRWGTEIHGWSSHNITLAGELIDFDGLTPLTTERLANDDFYRGAPLYAILNRREYWGKLGAALHSIAGDAYARKLDKQNSERRWSSEAAEIIRALERKRRRKPRSVKAAVKRARRALRDRVDAV